MRTVPVMILGQKFDCRGYWCSHCREKEGNPLDTPQFIFYLMATNGCNGLCPMCDIKRSFLNKPEPDPDTQKLTKVLEDFYTRNLISKISITGGDPLLYPERTSNLLDVIYAVNPKAKVDITTNGSLLANLRQLRHVEKLTTIHISRHHFDNAKNDQVFGVKTADINNLRLLAAYHPGKISLNCCLIEGYIDTAKLVEEYLDWAATISDLKSAGFISLMSKNKFCETNSVQEKEILTWIDEDPYNFDHEYLYDTDICECRVWRRVPKNYHPMTAFWWKVNRLDIPYFRQPVYTADNRLMVNFNEQTEICV